MMVQEEEVVFYPLFAGYNTGASIGGQLCIVGVL
jgi:hypothetical protein